MTPEQQRAIEAARAKAALADRQRAAIQAAQSRASGQAADSQGEVPDGMFLNPNTGQYTSRELLANAPAGAGEAAGSGFMRGYAWSADDELIGGVSAAIPGDGTPGERAEFGREYMRARNEAAFRDRPILTTLSTIAGGVGGGYNAAGVGAKALGALGKTVSPAVTTGQAVGRMAGAGALGGAAEGFASGEGTADRLMQAGIGGVAGAVIAPTAGYAIGKLVDVAGRVGGRALQRVFSSKDMFDPATGQITESGQRALRTLGYNVDELTERMRIEMTRAAEDAASGRIPADAVEGVAAARRFGLPLTRGQMTGDVAQIGNEEAFRAGTRGEGAYRVIREMDERQGAAVRAAREGIIPGPETDRIDAADTVITAVRGRAEDARQAGRAAYRALEESGAAIRSDAIGPLRLEIERGIGARGITIGPRTPNAASALDVLEAAFKVDNGGSVPFMAIERARQDLNKFARAAARGEGADEFAMGQIKDTFDDWIDDRVTGALISGDDGVIGQAKEARNLWRQYRETFLGRKGADNFIRKIVEDDLAPDQVAGWLFGSSSHLGGGQTSLTARRVRDILGADSPEWQSVRRAAWDQATTGANGQPFGPDKIVSNIDQLMNGKGKTLAAELFSPDEMKTIREFRTAVNRLRVPSKAANPSGTSYANQRAMQELFRRVTAIFGSVQGGPVAGVALDQAVSTGGNFRSTLAARAAANGIDVPTISPAASAGGGIALMGAAPSAATSLLNQERR